MSADGLQQLLDTARAERDRARRELATLADLILATATVYTDQALLEAAKKAEPVLTGRDRANRGRVRRGRTARHA